MANRPLNQVTAARYVGQNYDLSEADPNDRATWCNELVVAMDVMNLAEKNRPHFVRNARTAYDAL